jgi:thioester reductase-like protein
MSGYAQSKWVAEKVVSEAQERGLPVTIYRPGFIEGNSETGFCNPASELCLTLKACVDMGMAPDHDMMFDAAPVDYASKAIVYLSLRPDSVGRIFNAVNVHPAHIRQVIDWISETGHPLKRIPYLEWREQVIKVVAPDPGHPFYPLLPYALDFEIARMPLAFPCDCSNTLGGLADSGISCPPVGPALLATCLDYLERVGFLPPRAAVTGPGPVAVS